MLILKHENNLYSIYAFLGNTLSHHKERVKKGQAIATVSKEKDQAFFHFEIRSGKTALDPVKLLPKS